MNYPLPFKKLYIEITNICNQRCAFCAEGGRKPGQMYAGQFSRVLEALAPLGGHVYPHVLGEPLLHPELPDILDVCRAKGRPVNLATNGKLLAEQADMLLSAQALRLINISLHSARDKGPEAAAGLLQDVLRFAKARRGERPYITIRLWRGADRDILSELSRAFPGMTISPRSGHEAYKLAAGLFLDLAEPFEWPVAGSGRWSPRCCPGLSGQLAVLVDGTVVPCCLDARGELGLGNIFEGPIEGILSSPRAKAIREGFKSRNAVEPLCRGCAGKP